ncbi:MAG: ketopantoate reductase C-terminal domain-containing protein, partial [Dongiaceae bacterium]
FDVLATDGVVTLESHETNWAVLVGPLYDGGRFSAGSVTSISTLGANGRIEHLGKFHRMTFGERDGRQSERVGAFAALAAQAKFESAASDDILQEMWEKWVLLATLAGMTCLMRGPVGAIVATREGEALTNELLGECSAIATASGQAPRAKVLEPMRATLTARGSSFTASMLRDIERCGPTEGEHILGDLLQRARALGVAAPLLRIAACHVEAYEARRK